MTISMPELPPVELTLTSLAGLRAAGVVAGIKPSGKKDVALLVADAAVSGAALFTQNHFRAAPVEVSHRHLARSGGMVRALIVSSGNANACTGTDGERDALAMCAQVAEALGCPVEQVLVCSTGVIGVKLPMDKVRAGIAAALSGLSREPDAGRDFLDAIMTTDAYPKEACARYPHGSVVGVCKGAGMIEPSMATMLAFLATDAALTPKELAEHLPRLARSSFNAVHVDSHASTNDTFLMLATGSGKGGGAGSEWLASAQTVARRLAWLIARDGEGATKVTEIVVRGAASDAAAQAIARRVATSALVRTALFGCDPNWGRFTSAVGNAPEVRGPKALRCVLQGVEVFAAGEPRPFDRASLSASMRAEDVLLELVLADGKGEASLFTSDLGYRYVEVNAEYST